MFKLDWKTWLKVSKHFCLSINMISSMSKDDLYDKFPDVFTDGIGTIKGSPVVLRKNAKPIIISNSSFCFKEIC